MSDQSRLCDKHGEVVLFFGNNGPDDPGECPWCEVSRLREEKEASWNSAEHNARRAEAAEAEVARLRAKLEVELHAHQDFAARAALYAFHTEIERAAWRAEALAAREMLDEHGTAYVQPTDWPNFDTCSDDKRAYASARAANGEDK